MTGRETYDELVRSTLGPPLQERGFKRRRTRFARPQHGGWQIVDFQASAFGSKADVEFTVNLAVVYAELREPEAAWTASKPPSEAHGHCRARIGHLLPEGLDTWWSVTADSDTASLGRELRN